MIFSRPFIFRLCFFLAAVSSHFLFSQSGKYFISNFSPVDYNGSDQNWASLQDELGRVFVANSDGVLMNDGKTWKIFKLRGEALVKSLAKNDSNVIFVGGENEFGFLKKKENGKIEIDSLSATLPDTLNFGNIWAIKCIGEEVFFCSNTHIFQYQNKKLKTIPCESDDKKFHTFFKVGYHLFVRQRNVGFKVLVNGELKFLPGSEIFKDPANRVDFILPFGSTKYWVGSRTLGLFLLSYNPKDPLHSTFEKIHSDLDKWMLESELYCGVKINDHEYAIGSLKDGIMLLDSKFGAIKKIDFAGGLQDDAVKNIYVDFNGNLWLSLNYGVSFVEINTPVTKWSKLNGIRGTIESVIKFQNRIYIANDKGVQVLDSVTNQFVPTEIYDGAWHFTEFENSLLAATDAGLMQLKNGKAELLYEGGMYLVYKYPYDAKTFFLGMGDGVVVGKIENGQFKEEKLLEGWGVVKWAAAEENGNVAFGTTNHGVYIVNPENNEVLKNLTEKEGLPNLIENSVFNYNGKIYIATNKAIYKIHDEKTWECIRAKEFDNIEAEYTITRAMQVNDDILFQKQRYDNSGTKINELGFFVADQAVFGIDNKLLKRIKGIDTKDFFHDKENVYMATNDGLYCYNISVRPNKKHYYSFISFLISKKDTILQNYSFEDSTFQCRLSYSQNEISIVPAASDYFDKSELSFSWYLEGLDSVYNDWQKTPVITYNNLHEGSYVLHLKSANILGQEGNEIKFAFTISPPWYRSIIAYILYVIGAIVLIWLIISLNLKRLKAANIRLEKIIKDRTKTIIEQKAELEHKNQEITDSINYAKRIQTSILPDIEEIKKNWKNTFVFFQPKDIVSGDFFWWRKINEDEFYIAVADCTGHGVPGGFMCMICSDKLHEGAKISTTADGVLYHANNAIKETLKQGTTAEVGGNKDGMEIAMLRVNKKTKQIQFSGANRFLWIIKEDTEEIIEIKANKASIASSTEYNYQYTLHDVQLAEGDQIYMSSDGFPDQFGGKDGKKYMSKNFKTFVLSIKEESMKRQGELLKENINKWMEGYEQVDDLLVIGVKM